MATRLAYPGYAAPPRPHPLAALADLTLVALDSAERLSGLFARHTAVSWGVPQAAGRAGRVTVELVTRAVDTTGIPGPRRSLAGSPPPYLGIRVSLRKSVVLVEVWDSDPASPLPQPDSALDTHLAAVNGLCQRWDWYRPENGGKVIWAEITLTAQQLPQRETGRASFPKPCKPVSPESDIDVLRSALEALHRFDVEGSPGRGNVHPAQGAAS